MKLMLTQAQMELSKALSENVELIMFTIWSGGYATSWCYVRASDSKYIRISPLLREEVSITRIWEDLENWNRNNYCETFRDGKMLFLEFKRRNE